MGSFLGFPGEDVTAAAKMLQVGLGRGQGPAALSSILGQHRAGGVSPGPRGLPCAPRGCSPAAGGAQPCGSLGRDHHQTPFIPFSSTLLHPKSQLLTQKTPNLALFGARADSCQSVPPHRCREPVPKPPAPARLSPHPAPFWLIPLGRELIGIYLTAPSASRAISLSLLGRRRRREPAEGARFSPFPVPSCSFPS